MQEAQGRRWRAGTTASWRKRFRSRDEREPARCVPKHDDVLGGRRGKFEHGAPWCRQPSDPVPAERLCTLVRRGRCSPLMMTWPAGRSEQEGVQCSLPGHEATGRSSGSRGFRARPPPGTPPLLAHAATASVTAVIRLASARRGALRRGPGQRQDAHPTDTDRTGDQIDCYVSLFKKQNPGVTVTTWSVSQTACSVNVAG